MGNCHKCGKKIGLMDQFDYSPDRKHIFHSACYKQIYGDYKSKGLTPEGKKFEQKQKELETAISKITFTTGFTIENKKIIGYKGIVSSEIVLGVNIFKDIVADISDIFGGRIKGYEQELKKGKNLLIAKLGKEVLEVGGNAVIGINLNVGTIGIKSNSILLMMTGTAVVIN